MSRAPASTLTVRQARAFGGEITVPGDKSLSHRAVLFAALADGTTIINGFLPGEDCVCTMRMLQAMGCGIEVDTKTRLVVTGINGKLKPPLEPLDCGNSGTAMRLMAGVLAGQPFTSRLIGDPSLSGRPMTRIVDPLTKRARARPTPRRWRSPAARSRALNTPSPSPAPSSNRASSSPAFSPPARPASPR
jgi:5-enolpyruvylshikimate-3-phosphate synthase